MGLWIGFVGLVVNIMIKPLGSTNIEKLLSRPSKSVRRK
jgi:hypothetical protein